MWGWQYQPSDVVRMREGVHGAGSSDDEPDRSVAPRWLLSFLRLDDEGERFLFIQNDLQARFKACESDLAKVVAAATQLYMRLDEIVIDCRRVCDRLWGASCVPSGWPDIVRRVHGQVKVLDAMKTFIHYYHLEIVSQMSSFTTASNITMLTPEEILRLLDFIDVGGNCCSCHGCCAHSIDCGVGTGLHQDLQRHPQHELVVVGRPKAARVLTRERGAGTHPTILGAGRATNQPRHGLHRCWHQ